MPSRASRDEINNNRDYCLLVVVIICILCFQGYKQKKAFIIAEGPMKNTCCHFWKMIMDRKTAAIVMLGHLRENKMVS